MLAEALGSSGRAAAVQRFTVGGAPHLERLHYLEEYLVRAKRKPQLVLFEIAGGYDSGSVVRGSPDAVQRPHGRDDGRVERAAGITLAGEAPTASAWLQLL